MWRETDSPKKLFRSCRWIMVITRVPCAFSMARIACARLNVSHRLTMSGCSTMSAKTIQKIDERSKAIEANSGNSDRAQISSWPPTHP